MEKKTKGKENKKRRLCKMTKRKSRNVGVSHHSEEGKNANKNPPPKGKSKAKVFREKRKLAGKGDWKMQGNLQM